MAGRYINAKKLSGYNLLKEMVSYMKYYVFVTAPETSTIM